MDDDKQTDKEAQDVTQRTNTQGQRGSQELTELQSATLKKKFEGKIIDGLISEGDSEQSEDSARVRIKEEKEEAAKQQIDPIAELFRKQVSTMSKPNMYSQAIVIKPCSILVLMAIVMCVIYFISATNDYFKL